MDAPEAKHEPEAEKNKSKVSIWAALGQRFALRKFDLVILLVVALFIGGWVNIRHWAIKRGDVSSQDEPGTLRVGIVSWPGYAGGLTANNGLRASKDSDFWNHDRKLLVDFVLVEDEGELINKLASGGKNGGVDVIWSTVDSLARQYPKFLEKGVQPRAFLQVDWSRGADAIVAKNGIQQIEQLQDKTVAVSMAASYWLLEYGFKSSNLAGSETKALPLKKIIETGGSQAALREFEKPDVDAAVLWEPDVGKALERQGVQIVFDTSMATHLIADVMVTRKEFIDKSPDVLSKFIEGWLFDGTPKAMTDPMLAAHVLQDEPGFQKLGEEKTRKLLEKVSLATFQDNVRMFGLSGDRPLFDQLFKQASEVWYTRKKITTMIQADQAREIGLLKNIYRGHAAQIAKAGCGRLVLTKKIAMTFKPGSAELSPEARHSLDDEDLSFQIRALSGVRFCVQVSSEGNSVQLPSDVAEARSNSIMDYLALRNIRPRSDFVLAGNRSTMPDDDRSTPSILLKVVVPEESANGQKPGLPQSKKGSKK